ncbi:MULTISPECIES: TetR/AcrR family transcriptional regulator [unclassified Clostridioides]|uniref:TetR/AcrR family transcriptional regulator n=1 Tax=unclassified Clostridioides TaxID=2635829 RepID=UPI001D111F03|nr:TetR/AcrR family transcriptional regulator [Clostridioides sp. ZZV15-6388]MCC0644929.1 TetR/AcrR family transcriptional regulator [Clostridioides sp. ZZV14-6150]MCC0659129.1 TetR/AcrR family transcriptional regulator [Clostridioides sp. ZZV14-6154]MCC0666213.1 TetR/AcrR family transcriptional regulator [Clostridioides sp. ZZV15-6597]MCC0668491.1 TetR/AcrR family transcriptional regulator [Clostridioides sp. ZZV14-6153]MCC0719561.1 TetR/AcrR family transcriptional regulator [Clostridioides s
MPKSYSDKEREYIVKRLKEEASLCIEQYGIRKTTVDELVRRVKIPKGTFYLFFQSKELLFFEVLKDIHDSIQNQMLYELKKLDESVTYDKLTDIFMKFYKLVDDTSILNLLINGEFEILMRKLPDYIIEEHFKHDDFEISKMISYIPNAKNKHVENFSGAFRAVFLTMLYKHEVGENCFDDALRLMIRGLVIQLME